jgi:hypothetical protein
MFGLKPQRSTDSIIGFLASVLKLPNKTFLNVLNHKAFAKLFFTDSEPKIDILYFLEGLILQIKIQ